MSYADDLTLAVTSIAGLMKMMEICTKYGEKCRVDYNPTKTTCVAFSRQKVEIINSVKLYGAMLKWVDKVKHLGNYPSVSNKRSYYEEG